ncbi:PspC domain-containing protein [Streptomyces paludis]|uniref:PspC domain-containing protein n=1 Tax=Streptomyces paludis TaxID=2282738 RepID=A0A345HSW2_9ACTN|nr:PspC domain-containing protein [Streptomyces paludis]AXG79786.1 PspC domain-containing protein [Streptomyces paludis]
MSQPPPPPPPAPPSAPGSASASASPPPGSAPALAQLRRAPRQKVFAGVCGGLGKYCDIDPVIFRIVIGVLTVTGGIGLIFYGFAWLLIPLEGEEENEARRLLSGRVDGASLIAVLLALIGCGLFLSMLGNEETLSFAGLLSIAVVGAAVWSQRRRGAPADGAPLDPASAHTVSEAPPETMAPPTPGMHSWWRDPIVKDGRTGPGGWTPGGWSPSGWGYSGWGHSGAGHGGSGHGGSTQSAWGPGGWGPAGTDYLWGPDSPGVTVQAQPWGWHPGAASAADRSRPRGPRGIAGLVFLLAVLATGLGTALSWESHPLGTSMEIGLAAGLVVLGLGLVVSSLLGRTGFGTILLAVITAGLLAGASVVPKDITTQWREPRWTASSAAAVQPHYQLGSGLGTLDLSGLKVPKGTTVSTSARVAAGQLKVLVPKGVTVRVKATAAFGAIRFPGDAKEGVEIANGLSRQQTITPETDAARAGTLDLTLEVGFGQVEVDRAAS